MKSTALQQETKPVNVNPLEYFKPEWEVSRKSVEINDLIVKYDFQTPYQIDFPKTNSHLIAYQISHGTHQVTRIGDKEYVGTFSSGEFFLHPAYRSGFYSWKTTDENVFFIVKPDFLKRIAEQSECLDPDRIELAPVLCDRDSGIENIALSFLREMQTEGLGGRLYSETLAIQLAIHLLRNHCTSPIKLKHYNGVLSPRKLQTVVDYIQANLEHKISLDTLARLTNTSPYHFSRLFKQATGLAPYNYVLQRRIELGKQLLRQELPIIEIAMICGFASQGGFGKAFRKAVGVTPKDYRQQF